MGLLEIRAAWLRGSSKVALSSFGQWLMQRNCSDVILRSISYSGAHKSGFRVLLGLGSPRTTRPWNRRGPKRTKLFNVFERTRESLRRAMFQTFR